MTTTTATRTRIESTAGNDGDDDHNHDFADERFDRLFCVLCYLSHQKCFVKRYAKHFQQYEKLQMEKSECTTSLNHTQNGQSCETFSGKSKERRRKKIAKKRQKSNWNFLSKRTRQFTALRVTTKYYLCDGRARR